MIAYFDCPSGISGDMILGALVAAGVEPEELRKGLACLPVEGYKLRVRSVKRAGLKATKVDVVVDKWTDRRRHDTGTKRWKDIRGVIEGSSLPDDIKQKGLFIFRRLFRAEAKVHGKRLQDVRLHELGAIDCIVDIFGALIGLDILGIKTIYSSPLNLGSGTVETAHGRLPIPAPATVELLQDVPVYSSDILFELTTPTGAAIISSLAADFCPMPEMRISSVGIGAGDRDFQEQPNILRLFICQAPAEGSGHVTVIETNIDDMNPQVYEYLMERLFKAGALDVFLTQVIMKKGRPGIKLTVLSGDREREEIIRLILKETTSIGLRFYRAERITLQREIKSIDTEFGRVRVKTSVLGGEIEKTSPEYEDCKRIARRYGIPLLEVMKAVTDQLNPPGS